MTKKKPHPIKYNPLKTRELRKESPGTKTIFTPELCSKICDFVIEGYTMRQIAAMDGMPTKASIFRAMSRNEDFAAAYAEARDLQTMMWEDDLTDIADNSNNDWVEKERANGSTEIALNHEAMQRSKLRIETRKWLMACRKPQKYGTKVSQEISGPDGGPVSVSKVERVIVAPKNFFEDEG